MSNHEVQKFHELHKQFRNTKLPKNIFEQFIKIYVEDHLMHFFFYIGKNEKIILHCPAKKWIYLTPYLCTERIFDSRPFMYNKMFLKKLY